MRLAAALAIVAIPAFSALAGADDLVPRSVTATLHGTTVELITTLQLTVAPQASNLESFALPEHAVITGAVVHVGAESHRLQLVRATDAAEQLTGLYEQPGAGEDRMWAVNLAAVGTSATVEIAAPRSTQISLDIEIAAATDFLADQRTLRVPCTWPALAAPAQTIGACTEELQEVGFAIARTTAITATAQRLSLPNDDLARVELVLPQQLSRIPSDLRTVIIVDRSRSMSESEQATASSVIASYLSKVPGSRVQAITFARKARTLLPGWTGATGAAPKLARALAAQPLQNGSNLEAALALASTQLARVKGTRRVLLVTDERMSEATEAEVSTLGTRYLPADTLLHVVDVTGAEPGIYRDSNLTMASLAAQTGGIAVAARDDGDGLDALLLARPLTLDRITVRGADWSSTPEDTTCVDSDTGLGEGQSCAWLGYGVATAGSVTVTGYLWGTLVTRVLAPDLRDSRALARRLSTDPALSGKIRDEIELAAQAVNTTWSLLVMWGTGGYADLSEPRQLLGSSIGSSTYGTSTRCGGYGHAADSVEAEMREQLKDAVAACRPAGEITATIETTLEEIVDVQVTASDELGRWAEDCITERIWGTALALSTVLPRRSTTIRFQP